MKRVDFLKTQTKHPHAETQIFHFNWYNFYDPNMCSEIGWPFSCRYLWNTL